MLKDKEIFLFHVLGSFKLSDPTIFCYQFEKNSLKWMNKKKTEKTSPQDRKTICEKVIAAYA